ncbi:MAG: DUF2085 domain-containing protein [Anaerolineae bacterium]|nr:DUF2085 domain-containing protein [Anaerolineae bacterium]
MTSNSPPAPKPQKPPKAGALRLNRLVLGFSRHWVLIAAVVVGIYASLPLVTPVLMEAGFTPARVFYTLYAPFCHQFGFRSFFTFGDQPVYPRAIAGTDQVPFEAYAVNEPEFLSSYDYWYRRYHNDQPPPQPVTVESLATTFTPWFQFASKDFIGSETMGYKTTLCVRDVAIYGAIFLGIILYSRPFVRRRLRPVPLFLYLFLGVLPIALDGGTQLLGYPPFNWWPPRETIPIFRIATGALFGIMTAWLALPYFDASMQETRHNLEMKFRKAGLDP